MNLVNTKWWVMEKCSGGGDKVVKTTRGDVRGCEGVSGPAPIRGPGWLAGGHVRALNKHAATLA